jgi:hypothetical protein
VYGVYRQNGFSLPFSIRFEGLCINYACKTNFSKNKAHRFWEIPRANAGAPKCEKGEIMPYTPRERGQEFRVLGRAKPAYEAFTYAKYASRHMSVERQERQAQVMALGTPTHLRSYVVDTNHIDGVQLHSLYNTGIIVIASLKFAHIITMFIATPAQIKRYTRDLPDLEELAYAHMCQGLTQ